MPSCSHPKLFHNILCPCGKCINCRRKRQNDWVVRMELERQDYDVDKCLFVTLTYSNDNLPSNGLLSKRDLQLFMKRLRKYYPPKSIRYFATGEYGSEDNTHRPHYHLVLYGVPYSDKSLIDKCWNLGFTCIKPLNSQNCRYVSKYCNKGLQKDKIDFATGEIVREFVTMSRRQGLGFAKLDNKEFVDKMVDKGFIVLKNKFNYSIPQAFKRKLKENNIDIKKDVVYSLVLRDEATRLLYNTNSDYRHIINNIFYEDYSRFIKSDHLQFIKIFPIALSFREYYKIFDEVKQSEKNWTAKYNISYNDYYDKNKLHYDKSIFACRFGFCFINNNVKKC